MGERLKEEVKLRAELRGENPKAAAEHLRRNLESLREHLTKRRKFLLDQEEIKKAGKFDRNLLKAGLDRIPGGAQEPLLLKAIGSEIGLMPARGQPYNPVVPSGRQHSREYLS